MKAIGYIRVSTVEQAENGNGLAAQENAIFEYCARQGLEVVEVYRDEGTSGASGEAVRPGLASLLAALENGEAEALVVAKLDRLARDLILQETIVSRLAKKGVSVVSVSEPELMGDPTRDMIRQILGAVSQYERALIKSRLRAGKAVKKAAGGYIGGRPAFGWKVEDGRLVHDSDEQRIIHRIKALQAEGFSLNGMAKRLNDEGYPSKMGTAWSATTVRRVIRRLSGEGLAESARR